MFNENQMIVMEVRPSFVRNLERAEYVNTGRDWVWQDYAVRMMRVNMLHY